MPVVEEESRGRKEGKEEKERKPVSLRGASGFQQVGQDLSG